MRDDRTGGTERLPTNVLFVFIGGMPQTSFLDGVLALADQGFVLIGPDLVRHGSVKRVAAAVGEGATAVQFIHRYLASAVRTSASSMPHRALAR